MASRALFPVLAICLLTFASTATGTTAPTTTTMSDDDQTSFECSSEDNLFASAPCSSRFFQCSGGTAYPMDCPSGTIFNPDPRIQVCDWKFNVAGCKSA